jgi:hypothetical protein
MMIRRTRGAIYESKHNDKEYGIANERTNERKKARKQA